MILEMCFESSLNNNWGLRQSKHQCSKFVDFHTIQIFFHPIKTQNISLTFSYSCLLEDLSDIKT